jgi:hypothetical protein
VPQLHRFAQFCVLLIAMPSALAQPPAVPALPGYYDVESVEIYVMRLHREPVAEKRTDGDKLEVQSVPSGRADSEFVVYAAPIKYTLAFPFFPERLLHVLAPQATLLHEPDDFEPHVVVRLLTDDRDEIVLLGLDESLVCTSGTCWKQTKQVKVLVDRWKSIMKGLKQ